MNPMTMPFDDFWRWLMTHPNCILRAGTPNTIIYDDEDLHWHFASEVDAFVVQLIRGKRLMSELIINPEAISYVNAFPGEHNEEFVFELLAEAENEQLPLYYFVLAHSYDQATSSPGRVH